MKRETLYKIVVLVLLTINIVQVSFFLLTKKPKNNSKNNNKPSAREMLYLEDSQQIQFKKFSEIHHEAMVLLQEEQKKVVKNYFMQPTDSLLNRITVIEAEKIKVTETHFENMRSVLKDDQLLYYEQFKDKALKFILR